jgi:cbb3-type cytochrome oxidase maturation protein
MSVIFVLVFVAIIMAGAFLVAFIWSVKNGQYEDTYTPSVRILFDDPVVKSDAEKEKSRSDQSQSAEKKEKAQTEEQAKEKK